MLPAIRPLVTRLDEQELEQNHCLSPVVHDMTATILHQLQIELKSMIHPVLLCSCLKLYYIFLICFCLMSLLGRGIHFLGS